MNYQKAKLFAFSDPPYASIVSPTSATRSTLDKDNVPHKYYKYLGIFLFTNLDIVLFYDLCLAQCQAYFSSLLHLPISLLKWAIVTNLLLIDTLSY